MIENLVIAYIILTIELIKTSFKKRYFGDRNILSGSRSLYTASLIVYTGRMSNLWACASINIVIHQGQLPEGQAD